jgi:hypothetical protein
MDLKAEYDINLGHMECENHAASRKMAEVAEEVLEERMPRKLLHGRIEGRWRRGRPRKRCLQSLEEDLRIIRVGRWWEKMGCREEWGSVVREAKAHSGL